MSETKRLDKETKVVEPGCTTSMLYDGTSNGRAVGFSNGHPYPVEVTVRRVAEKIALDSLWRVGYFGDKSLAEWGAIQRQLNAAGYANGDSVRVTVEPLD